MAFNEEQFIRDILGATGGKVTIEKGTLNKSFEEMKEDLDNVFKPREPLFTLTAEEVENLKIVAQKFAETYKEGGSTTIFIRDPSFNKFFFEILTRINKWQNEIQKQGK